MKSGLFTRGFNNNIGCIETLVLKDTDAGEEMFNNNIGCIETAFHNFLYFIILSLITT